MDEVQLLIGGRSVAATGGGTFERSHPLTPDMPTRAAAATVADAARAAEAAAAALPQWSALGPTERRARLLRAADALRASADELVACMTRETGATAHWGRFNVDLGARMLEEAAAQTTRIDGRVVPSDVPGSVALAVRQPAGVVLGIAPWNAPVILGVRAVAMPLACGNTVVLKASEICPGTHRLIGTALDGAGLGAGVVNVLTHPSKAAETIADALIAHPAIRRINFTGSTRVGRLLAERAGRYLKPILLELGGKAPLVVLDDADVDAAVDATVFGAFANQGQICMSTERVIAMEAIAGAFVRRLAERVAALPMGSPERDDIVLGPLVGTEAAARVRALVDRAVQSGATLVTGGELDGPFLRPMVVDHVTVDMELFTEESFGPQVCVTRVFSEDAAVAAANASDYGLSAAVFTRDVARGLRIAQRLRTGICHINGPTVHDEPQMPFGGTLASGYGRFGGDAAIAEFTELRWITVQTTPRAYPF